MLYAAPGTMNGVNTIDLWRGLGAQQRFLAQARRGQNGSVQHLFESVQASVNVYETRSGTEHFPFLLRAGLSVEVPLMRGGWSTERLGRTSGRLRYTGTELTTDDRVVIFHPETITQLAEADAEHRRGDPQRVRSSRWTLTCRSLMRAIMAAPRSGWSSSRPRWRHRPYRLYIHKGGIIPESADVDGDLAGRQPAGHRRRRDPRSRRYRQRQRRHPGRARGGRRRDARHRRRRGRRSSRADSDGTA